MASFENAATLWRWATFSKEFALILADPRTWYHAVLVLNEPCRLVTQWSGSPISSLKSSQDPFFFKHIALSLKHLRSIRVDSVAPQVCEVATLLSLEISRVTCSLPHMSFGVSRFQRNSDKFVNPAFWSTGPGQCSIRSVAWPFLRFASQDVVQNISSLYLGLDTLHTRSPFTIHDPPDRTEFHKDQELCILDTCNRPYVAVVINVNESSIFVAYYNWRQVWSEWIPKTSDRILSFVPYFDPIELRHELPDLARFQNLTSLHIDTVSVDPSCINLQMTPLLQLRHLSICNSDSP